MTPLWSVVSSVDWQPGRQADAAAAAADDDDDDDAGFVCLFSAHTRT